MHDIKPKETLYNGYLFRSKLEARWAVFFDKLGIEYEYEPEAFVCADGSQYTPDFLISKGGLRDSDPLGLYIEIKRKGWVLDEDGHYKYKERIGSASNGRLFLVLFSGDPFDSKDGYDIECEQIAPFWDNYMRIFICEKCGHIKAEYSEGNYMNCPMCNGKHDATRLFNAAQYARSFRFPYYKSPKSI